MSLIELQSRPMEKSTLEKKTRQEIDQGYNLLHWVLSTIYPETMASQKKGYDEWKNQANKIRSQELDKASNILDNLSHRDRITYFGDAISKGIVNANSEWINYQLKWRVVEDSRNIKWRAVRDDGSN